MYEHRGCAVCNDTAVPSLFVAGGPPQQVDPQLRALFRVRHRPELLILRRRPTLHIGAGLAFPHAATANRRVAFGSFP